MIFPRRFSRSQNRRGHQYEEYRRHSQVSKELEEHLRWAIAENGGNQIDSEESTTGSKNVETLAKAYASVEKAEAERLKVELAIADSRKRQWVNWDTIIPKVAGVAVTGMVTIFWICLEQGTPVPSRLVKMTSDLTLPRGL